MGSAKKDRSAKVKKEWASQKHSCSEASLSARCAPMKQVRADQTKTLRSVVAVRVFNFE